MKETVSWMVAGWDRKGVLTEQVLATGVRVREVEEVLKVDTQPWNPEEAQDTETGTSQDPELAEPRNGMENKDTKKVMKQKLSWDRILRVAVGFLKFVSDVVEHEWVILLYSHGQAGNVSRFSLNVTIAHKLWKDENSASGA